MDWSAESGSLSLATLKALYGSNAVQPSDVIRAVYRRLDRFDHVWITKTPLAQALAVAADLPKRSRDLPLYGMPFAVKDNIDVAGMPTTAGCKEFARTATTSATVVRRLQQNGA